jgi:hypothetical protein
LFTDTVSIEEALYKFPHVWDAGAIGIPDPGITLGELPVGAVVLKPGSKLPTSEEVREFCRGRMAGFAVPVYVDVRVGEEGLPRNVNGKLVKRGGFVGGWLWGWLLMFRVCRTERGDSEADGKGRCGRGAEKGRRRGEGQGETLDRFKKIKTMYRPILNWIWKINNVA